MKNHSHRLSYALFSAPALILYSAVIIGPVLYSVILSFTSWSGTGTPTFIGFDNYVAMFGKAEFRHAMYNNLTILLISVFLQIPIGFFLAWILYRKLIWPANLFQSLLFFPVVISPVVVALLFQAFFDTGGVLEAVIGKVRDDPLFILTSFNGKYTAIIPILIVLIWMYSGLYMIIFLANLQRIPSELIEAAIMDGAAETQIMFRVGAPLMGPVFVTSAIFAIAGSLKSFDLIFIMTGGGPSYYTEVLASHMYRSTFDYYNYGYGAAVTVVIVAFSVGLITLLLNRARRYTDGID